MNMNNIGPFVLGPRWAVEKNMEVSVLDALEVWKGSNAILWTSTQKKSTLQSTTKI